MYWRPKLTSHSQTRVKFWLLAIPQARGPFPAPGLFRLKISAPSCGRGSLHIDRSDARVLQQILQHDGIIAAQPRCDVQHLLACPHVCLQAPQTAFISALCCISASNRQLRHQRKRGRTLAVYRLRIAELAYAVCCRQGYCAPSL